MSVSPVPLPDRPSLEHLRKAAKRLLRALRRTDPARTLADAQHALARRHGFATWAALRTHVLAREAEVARAPGPVAGAELEAATDEFRAAVRAGDADAVRALVARHPVLRVEANAPSGPFGGRPLLAAASAGNLPLVDALLDAGASIDARSDWWAGGFGVLDDCPPAIAPALLARGATLDAHAAARLGMVDALTALLDAEPARVHARGGDGRTPLHVAATVEVARLLLERGADPDARDVDHESTPAQHHVGERPEVARFLVARGCRTDLLLVAALGDLPRVRAHVDADPGAVATAVTDEWFPKRNPHAGGTIYQWTLGRHASAHRVAHRFGHPDVLALLFARSPAPVALAAACEIGDGARAREIRARHPDVVARLSARERRRPADAAQDDDLRALAALLDAGWPVDARGQHDATPLHWAAWHGSLAAVRLLLARGAPLDARDRDYGGTPLTWALRACVHGWHPERGDYAGVVRALLDAGAARPATAGELTEAVRAVYDAGG
jgi:ankyrin repeat protein